MDLLDERQDAFERNKKALYAVITNNISKVMKSKIVAAKGCLEADKKKDPTWLLEVIDNVMLKFEKVKNKTVAVGDQMEQILRMRQRENQTNNEFQKAFTREIKVWKKHSGAEFLWGTKEDDMLNEKIEEIKAEYKSDNGGKDIPEKQLTKATELTRGIIAQQVIR